MKAMPISVDCTLKVPVRLKLSFGLFQIVKVETRLSTSDQGGILVSKGEYVAAKAGKGKEGENGEVMSSFRPTDNAKLYASPEDIKTVGFRSRPAVGFGLVVRLEGTRIKCKT